MWHKLRIIPLILFIPILEFLFFRYLLHYPLGIRIGLNGIVDADLFYPAILTLCLLFSALHSHSPFSLSIQKKAVITHLIFLTAFTISTLGFANLYATFSKAFLFFWITWITLALMTFGSALFLFFPIRILIRFPFPRIYLPILLLISSKWISAHLMVPIAEKMQIASTWSAAGFLKFFYSGIQVLEYETGEKFFLKIVHPQHALAVGVGCSGLDGVLLILFSLLVTWILHIKKASTSHWIFLMCLGSIYMFLVNLARLGMLFSLPIWVQNLYASYPPEIGVFLASLHEPLGWISYLIACLVFYRWIIPLSFKIKDERMVMLDS